MGLSWKWEARNAKGSQGLEGQKKRWKRQGGDNDIIQEEGTMKERKKGDGYF